VCPRDPGLDLMVASISAFMPRVCDCLHPGLRCSSGCARDCALRVRRCNTIASSFPSLFARNCLGESRRVLFYVLRPHLDIWALTVRLVYSRLSHSPRAVLCSSVAWGCPGVELGEPRVLGTAELELDPLTAEGGLASMPEIGEEDNDIKQREN
jgi:hypothetical protein